MTDGRFRRFDIEVKFSYEAEIFEEDPQGDWAFADIQQAEVRDQIARLAGVNDDLPIHVKVTPV